MTRQRRLRLFALAVASSLTANAAFAESGSPAAGATATGMTLKEARRFFVCRTHMSFDEGHGTQVFYVHPDGTEFLWYPGNNIVVTTKWQFVARVTSLEPSSQFVDWCLQFEGNSYNPVTKRQGRRLECRSAALSRCMKCASMTTTRCSHFGCMQTMA